MILLLGILLVAFPSWLIVLLAVSEGDMEPAPLLGLAGVLTVLTLMVVGGIRLIQIATAS